MWTLGSLWVKDLPEVNEIKVVFIHNIKQQSQMSTVYSFPSSLVKELRWHGIRLRFFRRMSEDSAQLIDGGLCVERVVQIDWKWFHQARTVHYSGYWEFACFKDMKAKIYALPICRWLRNHFQGLEKGVVFLWAVLWPSLSLGEKKKTRKPGHDVVFLTTFFFLSLIVFVLVLEACMPLIHVIWIFSSANGTS